LPAGKKSIAVGLDIGDNNKTLTETEIDETITRVLKRLDEQLGAHLRD
jgi:phenylalanyl-tRNA synthetase beta chain